MEQHRSWPWAFVVVGTLASACAHGYTPAPRAADPVREAAVTERPAAPRARRAASREGVEGAQVLAVQRGGGFTLDGRAATEAELVERLRQGVAVHPERATVISVPPRVASINSGAMDGFYPDAARDEGISGAHVPLMLTIEADGRVSEAVPIEDPGYGFARAAVRCVMSGTIAFQPARDTAGVPTRARLRYVIHFELAGDAPPQ